MVLHVRSFLLLELLLIQFPQFELRVNDESSRLLTASLFPSLFVCLSAFLLPLSAVSLRNYLKLILKLFYGVAKRFIWLTTRRGMLWKSFACRLQRADIWLGYGIVSMSGGGDEWLTYLDRGIWLLCTLLNALNYLSHHRFVWWLSDIRTISVALLIIFYFIIRSVSDWWCSAWDWS